MGTLAFGYTIGQVWTLIGVLFVLRRYTEIGWTKATKDQEHVVA